MFDTSDNIYISMHALLITFVVIITALAYLSVYTFLLQIVSLPIHIRK